MRMGLREANQRFSTAVRAVKAGEEVVLTERGKPIALLTLLSRSRDRGGAVRRLQAAGLLRAAVKQTPMPAWTPRALKGAPLSKTIRDERDAS